MPIDFDLRDLLKEIGIIPLNRGGLESVVPKSAEEIIAALARRGIPAKVTVTQQPAQTTGNGKLYIPFGDKIIEAQIPLPQTATDVYGKPASELYA